MRPLLRAVFTSAAFATAVLIATSVWAGPDAEEIWFGSGPDSLAVDENNAVTAEGAKTKSKEIDRIPGEEDWEVRIAAKLNGYAGEGPLYIEFYQTVDGTEYKVWHHEESRYDGNRNLAVTTVLEANHGFNKDRDYRVQIVQNNGKKDIVLARGKIRLIDSGKEPAEGGGEEEGEEEAEEGKEGDEDSKQDELDTLAGGSEDEGDGADGAPPPIETSPSTKKGCSVVGSNALGFSGMLLLLGLGLRTRRRELSLRSGSRPEFRRAR